MYIIYTLIFDKASYRSVTEKVLYQNRMFFICSVAVDTELKEERSYETCTHFCFHISQ